MPVNLSPRARVMRDAEQQGREAFTDAGSDDLR